MTDDLGPRRENVPDPNQVADWVVRDVSDADDAGQGFLDALSTLDGLTQDDLCAVVIELARRIASPEGAG